MKIKQTRHPLIEEIFNSFSPTLLELRSNNSGVRQNLNSSRRVTGSALATIFAALVYLPVMLYTDFGKKYLTIDISLTCYFILVSSAIYMWTQKGISTQLNFQFHLNKHKMYPGNEAEVEVVVTGDLQSISSLELSLKMREHIFFIVDDESPSEFVRDYYKEIIYQSENNEELGIFTVKFMIPKYLSPSLSATNAVNNSAAKSFIQDFNIEWCLDIDCRLKNGLTEQADHVFLVLAPKSEKTPRMSENSDKSNFEYF